MNKLLVLAPLLLAARLFAQDLSGFEKVLLPVEPFVLVAGASGTEFTTRLDAASPGRFRYYFGTPGDIQTFDPTRLLPAPIISPSQPRSEIGRLLYVEKSAIDDVSMQLMLTSRAAGEPAHTARVDCCRSFASATSARARSPSPTCRIRTSI